MSYAANTHNGTSRNYNEDRISIVLDLKKPGSRPEETLGKGIK
jgi:serine/threonine protein phosphatase PrpC